MDGQVAILMVDEAMDIDVVKNMTSVCRGMNTFTSCWENLPMIVLCY